MSEVTDLERHKYELASKVWSPQGRILLKRGFNLQESLLADKGCEDEIREKH